MFIAHRGKVTKYIKENSLQAFKNAFYDDKYIGIECDLRVTKDNHFVINHNPLIQDKIIKLTNYQDLKKDIPLLKDLLRIKTNKILIIELKEELDLEKLSVVLNKSKRNIYVMSFNKNLIKRLSKYPRNFKVGVLNYVLNSEENYEYYDFICLLNDLVTDNLKNYFKFHNIQVIIYGVRKRINFDKKYWYIIDDKFLR